MRMVLDKQDNVDISPYVFQQARGMQVGWLRSDNYEDGYPNDTRPALNEAIEKDITAWQSRLEKDRAEQKLLVVQAYPFSPVAPDRILEYMRIVASNGPNTKFEGENFTMIPDSLLLAPGTLPVLVIRSPRLTIPSTFRVLKNMLDLSEGGGKPMALMTTCNVWSRVLYGFYTANGITPLVIDGDDYLSSQDYVREICKRLGLDPAKAQFSWPAMSEEEKSKMHPMEFASAEELFKSTGPDAGRTEKNMQSELTKQHQEEEFGQDVGLIEELIRYAMPHYEYLWERRLQL